MRAAHEPGDRQQGEMKWRGRRGTHYSCCSLLLRQRCAASDFTPAPTSPAGPRLPGRIQARSTVLQATAVLPGRAVSPRLPTPARDLLQKSLQVSEVPLLERGGQAPRATTPCPASGRRGVKSSSCSLPPRRPRPLAETHISPQRHLSAATVGAAAREAVRRTCSCCMDMTTTPGSSVRSTRKSTRSPHSNARRRRAGHAGFEAGSAAAAGLGHRCRASRAASPASLERPNRARRPRAPPLGGQLIPLVSSSLRSLAYAACSPRPACPPGPPRPAG